MRLHRIVGLLVATAAAVIMAPAAAYAAPDPYPAGEPDSSVSDGTVSDGEAVTFWGKGFLPFERITIRIIYGSADDTAAFRQETAGGFILAAVQLPRRAGLTVTADADGEFSVRLRLTRAGGVTLVATGQTSGVTVTENVQVVTSPDTGVNGAQGNNGDGDDDNGTALPITGPSGTPLLIALGGGAGAVLLGTALLLFSLRRRRKTTV